MALLKPGLCPLLTEDIVKRLAKCGIKRVLDFICNDPEKITSLCEISYKIVVSIRRVLLAQYSSFPVNGLNLYEESLATLSILSTRCQALDEMLATGIFTGEVTEIRGPAASGKTQICLHTSIHIVDSLSQNVILIDTACSFIPDRIAEILQKRVKNIQRFTECLSRIRICQCTSAHQLLDILTTIRESLNSQSDSFFASLKAVIIDSVPAVMLPYMQSVPYVEGQSLVTTLKVELNSLAKDFTLAVIVTNDSNPKLTKSGNIITGKNSLGYSWSTVACTQIDLQNPNYLNKIARNDRDSMHATINPVPMRSTHTMEKEALTLDVKDDLCAES